MSENQIDRYLLDLLSPDEREDFETRLKNDDALKNEVNQQRDLIQDVEAIGRLELKSKLQELHKELDLDNAKPKTKFRKIFYRVAVAAVTIGILTFGWFFLENAPTHSELYAQNFEPYELSLTERSGGEDVLRDIEQLYIDGKYSQAIPLLQNHLQESTVKSSQIQLALGIAYLETNQPKEAITQFNSILTKKDFNFEDEAQWYLGLTYLKMDEIENAQLHLNQLAADSSRDHHDEAKKLLLQVEK